jgi:16S rRNA (uracil1498-N3)-methyltransferase
LQQLPATTPVVCLSGPEGGLSPAEDALARSKGFVPVHLGPRVLRSETAALTALALALHTGH